MNDFKDQPSLDKKEFTALKEDLEEETNVIIEKLEQCDFISKFDLMMTHSQIFIEYFDSIDFNLLNEKIVTDPYSQDVNNFLQIFDTSLNEITIPKDIKMYIYDILYPLEEYECSPKLFKMVVKLAKKYNDELPDYIINLIEKHIDNEESCIIILETLFKYDYFDLSFLDNIPPVEALATPEINVYLLGSMIKNMIQKYHIIYNPEILLEYFNLFCHFLTIFDEFIFETKKMIVQNVCLLIDMYIDDLLFLVDIDILHNFYISLVKNFIFDLEEERIIIEELYLLFLRLEYDSNKILYN